jgi:hypothetical protein
MTKPLFFSCLILCVACISACRQGGADIQKSIFVEYGYEGMDGQPDYMKAMYEGMRIGVYADADYLTMESAAGADIGKSMRSTLLHEFKTGKTWIGISVDTVKIKIEEENGGDMNISELMGLYRDSSYTIGKTATQLKILEQDGVGYKLEKDGYPGTEIIVAPHLRPSEGLSKAPMFMSRGKEYYGLILGNNSEMGNIKMNMRAVKLEIDQPREASKILDAYRLVSREEGNRIMNAMMGGGQ